MINHKPMKDELISINKGLKVNFKPHGTWLHFSSVMGQKCTFCIESKFTPICAKAIKGWVQDTLKDAEGK